MKLFICLLLILGISNIKCQDSSSSPQESKDLVQPTDTETQPATDVDKEEKAPENVDISDKLNDYLNYDDDEEWDSLELDSKQPIDESDADSYIPETDLDESSEEKLSDESFEEADEADDEFNDDKDLFGDEDDDDDVVDDDWLQTYNVPTAKDDESSEANSAESDETAKSNWSYGKYLEEQEYMKEAKKFALRRWMFIVAVFGCLLLVVLMLVAILRLRKVSQNRLGNPYYTLKEDA